MQLLRYHRKILRNIINSLPFLATESKDSPEKIYKQTLKLLKIAIPETVTIKPSKNTDVQKLQTWLLLTIAEFSFISYMVPLSYHYHMVFSVLFRTVCNSIYSIMLLTQNGLDYQAQTLIRTLLEQYFILLSVIVDEEKRKAYMKNHEGKDATTSWYQNFKKDKFINMISKYLDNTDIKEEFINWINSEYSDYSSFVHNDFIVTMCYSLAHFNENSNRPNLCGKYLTREREILVNCFTVSYLMSLALFNMLRNPETDISLTDLLGSEVHETESFFTHLLIIQQTLGCNIAESISS